MSIIDRENVRTLAWALTMSILAGALYFLTAARDIVVGDSPELTMAAAIRGVAHPPGYPLFTMLGHIFTWLPLGSIPFRVNLLSVICNALTVGVVFLIGFRLTRSHLAAAVASLVLALGALFWSWSLVAEVFPLNNLLASLLVYFLVLWQERPERPGFLIGAALVFGLALTNHQTIVLLVPAIAFFLWRQRTVLFARPQMIVTCAAAILVGVLPYVYVLWAAARHPAYNWGGVSSIVDLVRLITRQSYGTFHLAGKEHQGGSPLHRTLALLLSFGPLMGLLVVLGLFQAYRSRRWYFWFTVVALLFAGPFFAAITNLNLASTPQSLFVLERFFLLPQVIAAPLCAPGLIAIVHLINRLAPKLSNQSFLVASGAVCVALVACLLTNYRRIDQSGNRIARIYAEDVFATIEPGTILLASGDGLSLPLLYLHLVEQIRPDVNLVLPLLMPGDWYIRQLREQQPSLAVPFDHYDLEHNNLKALIEANPGRPVAIVGNLRDNSLDRDNWSYLHGLVKLLQPRSNRIRLSQMVPDTEQLMKRYRPPAPEKVHWKSFESEILALYAKPAWLIGNVYEQGEQKEDAHAWYERALRVDPNFAEAREGLARTQ
jgi:4-amino-4-deoxy-L-arabinose transferase-like glycosyltransferase